MCAVRAGTRTHSFIGKGQVARMKNELRIANEETERCNTAYRVGDRVIYRAEGICDVVDVRRERFIGQTDESEYYILSPQNDPNSTVYVPVDNEALTALMRPLLSREEILSLCDELREHRMEWIVDSRGRNAAFREVLSIGDRREVIVLVNTVREHIAENEKRGKKPGSTDTGALRRGSKLLRDEFSPAIPMESDEVLYAVLDGLEIL